MGMKMGVARRFLLTMALLSLFMLGSGCSTTKSLYHAVVPQKESGLKKKVFLVPILDHAGLGKEKVEGLTSNLLALLSKDGGLILERTANPTPTTQKIQSPQFGIVIDPDQARRAEEMGANVLLMAVANPFEVRKKKTGIWPFRKVKKEVDISVAVNALDVVSGTLFLTQLESRTISVPVFEEGEDETSKPEIDENRLDRALSQILEAQVSAIRTALATKPWSGRILSANPEAVMINAGGSIGLTPGVVLEVYGQGESIRSASGRAIDILGSKVGELKTVVVMENQASAVPLQGTQFTPGQVVRLKKP